MKLTQGGFNILKTIFGSFSQSQVDGLNFIVVKCEQAGMTYPETAYTLATVFHETNKTMLPIKEIGSDAYLKSQRYYPFIGYGYVQLTWEDNYLKMGKLIGVDLVANPEKALEPEIASRIMTEGMLNGLFTGVGFRRKRPVSRYNKQQYVSARAIINGKDKAETIANYAMTFEKALRSI